ncbi:hypothetical protein BH09BAC5_BH09BAC5_17860 [soil metagenome]
MKQHSNSIALWMDHSHAFLIFRNEKGIYNIEEKESQQLIRVREDGQTSDVTAFGKNTFSNNEFGKHNKKTKQITDFYHDLTKSVVNYDEILLFGPTTAKDEFFNLLMDNKSFDGKKIDIESTDKMTKPQMKAYVKEYFSDKKEK